MSPSRTVPVIDGHNDTLLRLTLKSPSLEESFFEGHDDGHIDYPRAKEGGLVAGFFAVFVPTPGWTKEIVWREEGPKGPKKTKGWDVPLAKRVGQTKAMNMALKMIATLFRLEKQSGGRLKVIRTHRQLLSAMEKKVLGAILHLEGVEALTKDLDVLPVLHEAGLRSLGPVWSRSNAFGHGVPFNFPDTPDIGPGLSSAGKDLIRMCNELRILVDLSHMNAKGFWDVAGLSHAPLVATHSGAHALSPSPRNLTDDQLEAIQDSGGMVGVNFARSFLRKDGHWDRRTSLTEIVRHVRYIADRIGIDHVGLGSDFDGAVVPDDMKDAAGLPKLIAALREGGIRGKDLAKVAHGNWLRVLKRTWGR